MINLSTIHEKNLSKFHRNNYIISVTELLNRSALEDGDEQCERHISIETCKKLYPRASVDTIAGLLLINLQLKIQEGERNFLLCFNDENRIESMDLLNGLVGVLRLEARTEEQKMIFESIKGYANEWTHALFRAENKYNNIGSALKH